MLWKRLSVGVFMLWASVAVAGEAIDAKYKAIGAATLGKPVGAERSSAGGRVRLYGNGGIYSSKATGTHAVYGAAFVKYKSLGAEKGKLGFPVTDVMTTPDGGTQTLFRHGYILGDKAGLVTAQVTPKATFQADSISLTGGATSKMSDANTAVVDALPLPESPAAGGSVTCNCSQDSMRIELGKCAISPAGPSSIRCQKGSCSNSCVITIVKSAS